MIHFRISSIKSKSLIIRAPSFSTKIIILLPLNKLNKFMHDRFVLCSGKVFVKNQVNDFYVFISDCELTFTFDSRSHSLYVIAVPSVCLSVVCLSVMLLRPTQPVEICGSFSLAVGITVAISMFATRRSNSFTDFCTRRGSSLPLLWRTSIVAASAASSLRTSNIVQIDALLWPTRV